jgi:transposase
MARPFCHDLDRQDLDHEERPWRLIVLYELMGGEARLFGLLFPHLAGLDLDRVEDLGGTVQIVARTRAVPVACRGCGVLSMRVHDRYQRRLQDLSCGGRAVRVELVVRRLRCGNQACGVATFAEQVPGLTGRHQRRTAGLRRLLERVALALAGRAGSRLARALGAAVSRFTLIRLVRALPDPQIGQVTVLGVDDFAKQKGHSYATVLLDMDGHRVIDVLPDREAGTFARWLADHPGVRVICRDRAGAYAEGARTGAPQAIQVADRFHLWQNLAEAVEKTVIAHHATLRAPEPDPPAGQDRARPARPVSPAAAGPATPPGPDGFRDVCGRERRLVARHRERHAAVQDLLAEGLPVSEISRRLGLDRKTARKFARATSIEELLVKATNRAGILDPFKPYINQRWNDGITSAAVLHTELQAQGWKGSPQAVRRYVQQFRPADGRTRAARTQQPAPAPAKPPPPKPRRVVRWLMTRPDHLDETSAAHLAQILACSPGLAATATHVRAFATMMTERQGQRLDQWITDVRADPLPALHSFANGLCKDHDAVLAGLTLPYSSGAVEGKICKIKYLKRLMFGRANLDLLRKMALLN